MFDHILNVYTIYRWSNMIILQVYTLRWIKYVLHYEIHTWV
jgi:hypothetical protein